MIRKLNYTTRGENRVFLFTHIALKSNTVYKDNKMFLVDLLYYTEVVALSQKDTYKKKVALYINIYFFFLIISTT